jgi:hypothetical protein
MHHTKYAITFPIGYCQSLWIALIIVCWIAGPPRRGSIPQERDLRPFSAFEGVPTRSNISRNRFVFVLESGLTLNQNGSRRRQSPRNCSVAKQLIQGIQPLNWMLAGLMMQPPRAAIRQCQCPLRLLSMKADLFGEDFFPECEAGKAEISSRMSEPCKRRCRLASIMRQIHIPLCRS